MLLIDSEKIYRDQVFIRLNTDDNSSKKVVFTVKKAIFAD